MAATGTPSFPCLRMNAFCASENCDAFIVFRSSQPRENTAENSNSERSSFRGADQRKDRTMKRSRFTEEQIIAVLREQEAGVSTAEVCRKHGISTATFYGWKAKFGGMEVSEAKRLKQLEDENARLKRLLADAMLDNAALKDLMTQKNSDARRHARGCRPS